MKDWCRCCRVFEARGGGCRDDGAISAKGRLPGGVTSDMNEVVPVLEAGTVLALGLLPGLVGL